MILVDTSVWVDHLRHGDAALVRALDEGLMLAHPFIIGELACGTLHNRRAVLDLRRGLPPAAVATDAEAMAFIEARAVMGRGIGFIDVHLLASAALSDGTKLWTRDRRLATVAAEFGLAHRGRARP